MRLTILFALLMFAISIQAQSLIDLTKDEVKLVIKKERKDLSRDKSVVKQQFNYLKFIDRGKDETLIVYFTKDNICKTSKFIYDYINFDEVIENLNSQHKKVEDHVWRDKGTEITLTKQEWYFTVRTTKI